ncbi:hypothetical protein BN1708_019551, partial [Verticillium longisporum]
RHRPSHQASQRRGLRLHHSAPPRPSPGRHGRHEHDHALARRPSAPLRAADGHGQARPPRGGEGPRPRPQGLGHAPDRFRQRQLLPRRHSRRPRHPRRRHALRRARLLPALRRQEPRQLGAPPAR